MQVMYEFETGADPLPLTFGENQYHNWTPISIADCGRNVEEAWRDVLFEMYLQKIVRSKEAAERAGRKIRYHSLFVAATMVKDRV